MKSIALLLALSAPASMYAAQTAAPAKPAVAKPATAATKTRTVLAKKPGVAAASSTALPPGVPVVKGLIKPLFALRYQDIEIGTGPLAEPNKLYKVHYTGWLAADGKKFDSSFDHKEPVLDKDGKPEMDADGKPKLGEGQPIQFPQGRGRVIPGWDQGFEGMKIGGKRRLFIPYQLAYGALGRPPVIPAKANLIFDVELVDIADFPTAPMSGMPGGRPMPPRPAAPTSPAAQEKPVLRDPAPAAAPATPPTPPPAEKPVNPAQPN